jgi:hypothetical protein
MIGMKNFGIELSSQEVPLQVLSSIYNVSQLSSRWISVVPLNTQKTPKQKSGSASKSDNRIVKKIQVFGLLVHLSSPITRFTLNAYQTVSLTVTLFTYVMRILILRWASHLDAFSGYPLHT